MSRFKQMLLIRTRTVLLIALVAFGLSTAAVPARAAPERVVAVGDVHGSPEQFASILEAAGVIDGDRNWVGGSTVLVQTGDLMDRGADVREVLDLMRALETQAAAAGGELVSLLGNHEIYNLVGYFDYQSTPIGVFEKIAADFSDETSEKTRKKGYRSWKAWARRYPGCDTMAREEWMLRNPPGFIEYLEALSPRGEYGRWLRERAVLASVGDTLFLHGGLSPELVAKGVTSLEQVNELAAEELDQFDRDRATLEAEGVVLPFSPLGEIYCALAHELQEREGVRESKQAIERRDRLREIRERLPSSERWLLLEPGGPVWFRGYANWTDEEADPALESIFESFGGARVVVGHTPKMGEIRQRFGGRVYLIDTAMAYPEAMGKPAALEIQGDQVAAIYESGRVPLVPGLPPAEPVAGGGETHGGSGGEGTIGANGTNGTNGTNGAYGASESDATAGRDFGSTRPLVGVDGEPLPFATDAEILDFLRTADVIESKDLGKGVTRPKKLLLEKNGIRAHAVYHNVEETRERHRLANGELVMFFRDSYKHNVAAYELALMLGLANVPPVVVRKLGREEGSVQLFIENAMDEGERKEAGKQGLPLHIRRQVADMWVFDNLVNNIDRNHGNMLFDADDGFWMIDHTRTFARAKELYSPERVNRCSRRLLEALREIDEKAVTERLKPYLSIFEIRAMLKRRDKLVAIIDQKIAAAGEATVLFTHGGPDERVRMSIE